MTAWDICPTTHVDTQGWLVVDCPGHPDACVKLVEQRCGGPYVLAGANADGGAPRALIRSPAGTKYARQAAGEGYLRARCVTKLIEEHL
jgi:hypothetical protein